MLVINVKYLSELSKLKVFNYSDFMHIVGNDNLATTTLQNYLNKGYIKRIRRNLYSTVSLESNDCLADRFLIGSHITETSFISHHSAFEFYGYYNQVYNDVYVSSMSKFSSFDFEYNHYVFIRNSSHSFVDIIRGVSVSSIERTIVDSIKDSGKYSDLEETLNCISLIPHISIEDIEKYLEEIDSKMLYKKVGIILSLFKEKFKIPDAFFIKCHEISDSIKGHFDRNTTAHVYNAEWKIFIYKDLEVYMNKE